MDQFDRAKELDNKHQEMALKNQVANRPQEPEQWIEDGEVICIDCTNFVELPRLSAIPNAARCYHCQMEHEKHHG